MCSCGELDVKPSDLKFSETLDIAPISLSDSQKLLTGTLKWSYGSKTAFLPIFGHLVTLLSDLWTLNFSEMLKNVPVGVFY